MERTSRRRFLAAGGTVLAGGVLAVGGTVGDGHETTSSNGAGQSGGAGDQGPSGWRMHRGGPGHAGAATWTSGPRSEPSVAWHYEPESEAGSWHLTEPAVVDGTVYLGATLVDVGDPLEARVVALDADDGTVRWTYEAGCVEFGVPAVADGRVFVGDSSGRVRALDAGVGEELWTRRIGSGRPSPLAVTDAVFVTGDTTYALDPGSGAVRWETDALRHPSTDGVRVYGPDTRGDSKDALVAVEATTGERAWSFTLPGSEHVGARASPPLVRDGVVIGILGGIDAFYGVDARSGTELWNNRTDGTPQFSLDAQQYYILDRHALFGAHDAETDEGVWSTDDFTGKGAPPVVGGDTVYAQGDGSPGPGLVAFDAATGDVLWVGEGRPVAVADGTLYVLDGGGVSALR